jgi:hypothetical protein
MNATQALLNQHGEPWSLEHRESERLERMGGFLMTYGSSGCITLNSRLAAEDKNRGRESLIERLRELPLGNARVILWYPDSTATS